MKLSDAVKTLYAADAAACQEQLDYLSSVLKKWEESGIQPHEIGSLSSGERSSLWLAARKEEKLDSPLVAFLMLDPHLQKWVLNARELTSFIGVQIAGELF